MVMPFLQRVLGQLFESARFLGPLRWEIALATFRGLAKVWPQAAWIQRDLGRAYTGKGDLGAAEQACQRAVALTPEDPWAYVALAECQMYQNRWDEALVTSQQALQLDPSSPWLHHTYGKALLGAERYEATIAACQTALQLDDTVSWFYYHQGEALTKLCRWEEAIACLEKSLALNGGFPWAKFYLGKALLGVDRYGEAIALFQDAEQSHRDMPEFGHLRTYAQFLQEQDARIEDYLQGRLQAKATMDEAGDRPLDVLMITPYPTYPPTLGALTRMHYEARGLGQRHRLVVASFIFAPQDTGIVENMADYCDLPIVVQLGDALPRQPDEPHLIHKYSSDRLRRILQRLEPLGFDLVTFNFIYMAQYAELFPRAFRVLEEHNIESSLLQRFATLNPEKNKVDQLRREAEAVEAFVNADQETQRLAAYEDRLWPQFPLRTVVSALDQAEMDRRCPPGEDRGETWIVHNGIDVRQTPLLEPIPVRKLFFFGTLSYFPNIDGACYFVEEILPLIWRQAPELKLCIAGADPPQTLWDYMKDPRIEVIANPEDMNAVAQTCSISVVPLRVGSGTRIKILHAMALGLPVVSTQVGCEGLEAEDGEHLLIRNEPERFAQGVVALYRDEALRQRLREQGRSLVESRYDWQTIYQDYEAKLVKRVRTP